MQKEIFQQGMMRVTRKMPNLLFVINLMKLNEAGLGTILNSLSSVANVTSMPTCDPDAPDIRIWDLDNIQNGEPIPPTIIEKLKEELLIDAKT